MSSFPRLLILILMAVPTLGARATQEEEARVRAVLSAPEPAWVGQEIPLVFELLAPNQFAGTPNFDLPELPRALILRVGTRPTLGTETQGATSYSIQRHRFAVFGQRAGVLTVPPFEVRFSSRERFDAEPREHVLMTEPVEITLRLPPGAEGLQSLVSTTELLVEEAWDPPLPGADAAPPKVGDAFKRTITFTANGVSGMLFPPLPLETVEGLGAYPARPQVQDETQRGAFRGKRVEQVTYVCEREGTASIPSLVLRWWNTQANVLEREEFAAVEFTIAPNPALVAEQEAQLQELDRGFPWGLAVGLAVILGGAGLGWTRRATLEQRLEHWRQERATSEAGRFRALRAACSAGDPRSTLQALYAWLARRAGDGATPTLADFLEECGSSDLSARFEALQEAVVSRGPWTGAALELALVEARTAGQQREAEQRNALPPLNP